MADPITTILTTAAEHVPSATAVTIALKAAKDFLAKVTGPAVEELGEIGRDYVKGWRAKNGSAVLAGADKLLAEAGREPQAVPFKTLLPLLDAASLENDAALAAHWAALLANAADPAQHVVVQPGFTDVLRQLTPIDARVLTYIYQHKHPNSFGYGYQPMVIDLKEFAAKLGVSDRQFALSVDSLIRLRLCAQPIPNPSPRRGTMSMVQFPVDAPARGVCPTVYGEEFLAAVTPPTL